jgi:hypothetical protein
MPACLRIPCNLAEHSAQRLVGKFSEVTGAASLGNTARAFMPTETNLALYKERVIRAVGSAAADMPPKNLVLNALGGWDCEAAKWFRIYTKSGSALCTVTCSRCR